MRSDLQLSVPHPVADAISTMTGGSAAQALADFLNAVTTARTSLVASVDTVAGLFAGLAEGALDLDQVFGDRAMEM
ncbi:MULTISPECIES: hypothetical protein [Streptomyces]|uniref:PE domain-containing protein n=2 Tax=Streptomyces TaxID=1883 RepID=A0ABV9IWC0_9ACTN